MAYVYSTAVNVQKPTISQTESAYHGVS